MENIKVTEIRNGAVSGKTYEIEAADYIRIVKNKDSDGILNVGVEPIFDVEGEIEDFTPDRFYELPIAEQLELCRRAEESRYAMSISIE